MVCLVEWSGLALEVFVVEMAGFLGVLLVLDDLLIDEVPALCQNFQNNLLLLLVCSTHLLVNSAIVLLHQVAHSAVSRLLKTA